MRFALSGILALAASQGETDPVRTDILNAEVRSQHQKLQTRSKRSNGAHRKWGK